ncbi:hypothetical protein ACFW04_002215 [Cataglyphis niger]
MHFRHQSDSIEARIKILDQLWAKFEAQHKLIRTTYKERYNETDFVDTVENTYVQQRGKLAEYAERYQAALSTSAASNEQQNSDRLLKSALSKIKLSPFSDTYKDWLSFRDLFLSVIGENSAVFPIERFHYLRSYLQGKIDTTVSCNRRELRSRVGNLKKKHFENKKKLIRSNNFATFTAVAKMKGETAEKLSRVYHAVTIAMNAQESIGWPIESESTTNDSFEPPNHETLLNFITKRILTLNAAKPKTARRFTAVRKNALYET